MAADVNLGVYALITGLASAVPVPWLDSLLQDLVRGAALRRVAARHGVVLSAEARKILASSSSATKHKLFRMAAARIQAPFRVVRRFEDGAAALAAAELLDHYLAAGDRTGATLHAREAAQVRQAMTEAIRQGSLGGIFRLPVAFYAAFADGIRAAFARDDSEGRHALERLIDSWLDALAESPGALENRLEARFDQALARIEAT